MAAALVQPVALSVGTALSDGDGDGVLVGLGLVLLVNTTISATAPPNTTRLSSPRCSIPPTLAFMFVVVIVILLRLLRTGIIRYG